MPKYSLHNACLREGHGDSYEVIKKILEKKLKKFDDGTSNRSRVIKKFIKYINRQNSKNQTPLSIVTANGRLDLVILFLDNGANPNIKGSIGTPKEIAAWSGFTEISREMSQHR